MFLPRLIQPSAQRCSSITTTTNYNNKRKNKETSFVISCMVSVIQLGRGAFPLPRRHSVLQAR